MGIRYTSFNLYFSPHVPAKKFGTEIFKPMNISSLFQTVRNENGNMIHYSEPLSNSLTPGDTDAHKKFKQVKQQSGFRNPCFSEFYGSLVVLIGFHWY